MESKPGITVGETLQFIADSQRLLRTGLVNDDPETSWAAFERVKEKYGEKVATDFLVLNVNRMIDEGFEWGPKNSSIYEEK